MSGKGNARTAFGEPAPRRAAVSARASSRARRTAAAPDARAVEEAASSDVMSAVLDVPTRSPLGVSSEPPRRASGFATDSRFAFPGFRFPCSAAPRPPPPIRGVPRRRFRGCGRRQ